MRISALPLLLVLLFVVPSQGAKFALEQDDDGVTVKLDGKLFTRYVNKSGNKPILWPLIGPTGKEMTRQYPMREAGKTERADHPHHRSFWFDHGDVNGVSYWHEGKNTGTIEHRKFTKLEEGDQAVIESVSDWVDPSGKTVCQSVTTLSFGADADARWIDMDITVKAGKEEVKFGDTKEGSMGVRVAGSMKVDAKQGGKIVTSEGRTDKDAWGTAAAWVDYHGPVEDETLGVTIMNHPSSFRFPTYWHVRTYGLFAANPFGLHDFKGSKDADGSHTLKPGESFTLRYRVLLHKGDEKQADVAAAYQQYVKAKK